jgi:integrase
MRTGNSTFRVLSTAELTAVLGTIRHYGPPVDRLRRYALFLLLANYVTRVGEVLALRGEDIDWAQQRITLLTLKRRRHMTRTLPLYPVAAAVLFPEPLSP